MQQVPIHKEGESASALHHSNGWSVIPKSDETLSFDFDMRGGEMMLKNNCGSKIDRKYGNVGSIGGAKIHFCIGPRTAAVSRCTRYFGLEAVPR